MAKRKSTKWYQRSTKHTHETKDRVTRTPLIIGSEFGRSSRGVSSSFQFKLELCCLRSEVRGHPHYTKRIVFIHMIYVYK
jgi:hypothetical protein